MFQATIIGRVGQVAPYQGQNGQFLRVRVAVQIRQRGGQDRTEWATVFTPRVELMPYLTQGRQILATGHAQIDVYNGQASLTLHASHVELLAESMRSQIANLLPQLMGAQAPAQPAVPAQPVMPQAQPTRAQAPESAPAQPAVDPNLLAQALAQILGGNRAQPQAQTQNTAEVQANNAVPADAIPEAAPF